MNKKSEEITPIIIDRNFNNISSTRVAISQLALCPSHRQAKGAELTGMALSKLRSRVLSALNLISDKQPNLVVFPEISIDARLHDELREISNTNNSIIVAGSYYKRVNNSIISCSPIIFPDGTIYETQKKCISPFEKSVISEENVVPGTEQYVFLNTEAGNFGVLICADFLDESFANFFYSNTLNLDYIVVIACQPHSERYYSVMSNLCKNSKNGIYILYCNLKTPKFGDGNSALFAQVHKNYTQSIIAKGLSDLNPKEKIWQAASQNDFLICDLDTKRRKPVITTSVHDEPNIHIIANRRDIGHKKKFNNKDGKYGLVAFDMDGTIIRGLNFSWSQLWEFCGDTEGDKWRKYLKLYTDGAITYERWCHEAVTYFRKAKLTKCQIIEIAQNGSYLTKNFKEGMLELKNRGFKTAIISGGVDIFLRAMIDNYKMLFDHIFINKFHFDADDVVASVSPTDYDFDGKLLAVQELCEEYGLELEEAIFVGDRFNDQEALRGVGHSIVYSEADDIVSLTSNKKMGNDDFLELVNYIIDISN